MERVVRVLRNCSERPDSSLEARKSDHLGKQADDDLPTKAGLTEGMARGVGQVPAVWNLPFRADCGLRRSLKRHVVNCRDLPYFGEPRFSSEKMK